MALKELAYGDWKSGKTLFGLSMCQLGPIAFVDLEYTSDWYIMEHPTEKTKKGGTLYTLKPRAKALIGDIEGNPIIHRVITHDLEAINNFVKAAGASESIVGIMVDSLSVYWDFTSDLAEEADAKAGGLAWAAPKKQMRRFQYSLMSSEKHVCCTAHLQQMYNKNMEVTGEKPWTEKKVPHWFDLITRFQFPEGKVPFLTVTGERSAGMIPRGTVIQDPRFKTLLGMLEETPAGVKMPEASEVEYRNVRAAERQGSGGKGE